MGAPGAGKGTQTKRIVAAHNVPHISTGEIFRQNIRAKTELGNKVRDFIEAGQLAPDELACSVVVDRLAKGDCDNGYVLDGFPRSRNQAEHLERLLEERGETLDLVINLQVNNDEIVARLSARRMCPECGEIYSLRFNPPKNDSLCDACGTPLVQRRDDHEAAIRERLRIYHKINEPIIDYYEKQNKLWNINGFGQKPQDVFNKLEERIAAIGFEVTT